jgi:hypothetical protein
METIRSSIEVGKFSCRARALFDVSTAPATARCKQLTLSWNRWRDWRSAGLSAAS